MKRSVSALVAGALMITSLTACDCTDNSAANTTADGEIETIALTTGLGGSEEYDKQTYTTIITETHPVVRVNYEYENKYKELAKALEDNNKSEKEYQLDFMAKNRDYAWEVYNQHEDTFYKFESKTIPYVRRADSLVTSIFYTEYSYFGGVHGNYFSYGRNFDTKTGRLLSLSDVVTDKKMLAAAVSEQLDIHWGDKGIDESADFFAIIDEEGAISWMIDYNGITVCFMPYSISSYATGIPIVTASFEEYPDIVREEYKKTPSSYGIMITRDVPFYYDVTGDGKVDELVFSAYESYDDEDGWYPGKTSLYVNDKLMYDKEEWFYDVNASFIHTDSGNNYIYMDIERENGYHQTVCCDLSYGVTEVGAVDGGMMRMYDERDDNLIISEVLTNPKSFCLTKTTDIYSTLKGYKNYHVGKDGLPESDDRLFSFGEDIQPTFTMLKDIIAEVYDTETKQTTGEERMLKAGERVRYAATDNIALGYFKTEDGAVVEIEAVYDEKNYEYTIDGVGIDKIFDGIFYAG